MFHPLTQADYPNLFKDYQASLQAQQMLARERANVIPAADFKEILVIFHIQLSNFLTILFSAKP